MNEIQRGNNRGYFRSGWRGRWNYRRGHNFQKQNRPTVAERPSTVDNDSERSITDYFQEEPCPYKGWKLYFPNEAYKRSHPFLDKIPLFENYFRAHLSHFYKADDIDSRRSFMVDVHKFVSDPEISTHSPDLMKELIAAPECLIACLGLSMYQLICLNQEESRGQHDSDDNFEMDDPDACPLPVHARLINLECQTPICDLKASHFGKLVSVKGTVVRVSDIKPYCTTLAFSCSTCEEIQAFHLPDGKFKMPTKCSARECKGRTFVPHRTSELTKLVDWQNIKIQEMNDARQKVGRIPRTVECELLDDLVDTCVPGDVVIVTGIVHVTSTREGNTRNDRDKCVFSVFVKANAVVNSNGQISGISKLTNTSSRPSNGFTSGIGMEFTLKELYAVREIHEQKNLFHLIVNSLCPAIYGHEVIKAGLVLGLFGGTQKNANDHSKIPVRGDPHILVVGDPGLGKSQLLQACAHVSPRGVYVCGNTSTTTGLTVTIVKDSNNDNSLEAGALVLSDQGCCCIDELDKMGSQQQALLEAMEQQCVSIAKAGLLCSLPARASVLAAANPICGHYDKSKTVSENLKFSSALLSRFDLVFILLDKADEEMDSRLSEHVMAIHEDRLGCKVFEKPSFIPNLPNVGRQDNREPASISERLRLKASENIDPIPHQLLNKYIGYARQYVFPKINSAAATVLQEFYLELRKNHQTMDCVPITTRQLESLIRLTEARAKLELREEATEEDAKDVVEIMKYSMSDTFSNEYGLLDFQRSQNGSGMSTRSVPKKFVAVLTRVAERTNNKIFTMQEMRKLMNDSGLQVQDFEGFIESLNNQGFLLKKGPRLFELQTV